MRVDVKRELGGSEGVVEGEGGGDVRWVERA